MFHRYPHVTKGLLFAALLLGGGSAGLFAQAAPRQFFVVCMGQAPPAAPGGAATFYFSGVLQGPATALQAFRTGFTQLLAQRYAFKGVATCSPVNTEANAQTFMTQRSTALRNAKQNVVETGWTETAEVAAAASPVPVRGAAAPAATTTASTTANRGAGARGTASTAAATGNTSEGNGARGQSGAADNAKGGNSNSAEEDVASVLGALFGTKASGNGAGGNASGSGTSGRQGQTAAARGGNGNAGRGNTQSPADQISSTLTTVFNNKSTTPGGAARGGQPATRGNTPNNLPNGALGLADFGMTKLVVYGCGRQDVQVACVTELTNENAKDSLVQSANVWKDAFLVDDRGDRHLRTNGFFLNIDGEQRQQLDIGVGKTAKFILMFDNVQARVQKVTLRSQTGGLDVEDIGLISADAGQGAAAATPASPQR